MMDESSNWIQLHDQECYEYSHIVQQPPANTSKRLGNFSSGKSIGLLDQLIDCYSFNVKLANLIYYKV